MKKLQGTYTHFGDGYELHFDYTYLWDEGDYFTPPSEEHEVTSVYLDDNNITDFWFDFIGESSTIQEGIFEHANDLKSQAI